jgi:hypothetical protein
LFDIATEWHTPPRDLGQRLTLTDLLGLIAYFAVKAAEDAERDRDARLMDEAKEEREKSRPRTR